MAELFVIGSPLNLSPALHVDSLSYLCGEARVLDRLADFNRKYNHLYNGNNH